MRLASSQTGTVTRNPPNDRGKCDWPRMPKRTPNFQCRNDPWRQLRETRRSLASGGKGLLAVVHSQLCELIIDARFVRWTCARVKCQHFGTDGREEIAHWVRNESGSGHRDCACGPGATVLRETRWVSANGYS